MGKPGIGGGWQQGLLGALIVCAGLAAGCTRHYFRKYADQDVTSIVAHKDVIPTWKVEEWHVYPDPRARFADTTNPDRPPMPPDDPAARDLSPNPQKPGKAGIEAIQGVGWLDVLAAWDAENRASEGNQGVRLPTLEFKVGLSDPQAREAPGGAASKSFLLTLEQAVELGLFNSREFQTRRENLYLTALPVTRERFRFAPQFFAVEQTIRERTGSQTPEGAHNRWRLDGAVGFTQQFATGALLLAQFANLTVIEMLGDLNPRTISESVLTLDLVQPLLQGGGWAVTLEALTQSERDLLYEIRDYARFRKEFFVAIAGGGTLGGGNTPDAFQDIVGVGGTAPAAGFLPTLQRRAFLAIAEQNVIHLTKLFDMYLAFAEGGDLSTAQVDRVRLQLLNAQSQVLARRQDYQDNLDTFKLQLGLPTDLPIDLELAPLQDVLKQLREFVEISNQVKDLRDEVTTFRALPPGQLRAQFRGVLSDRPLVRDTRFRARTLGLWDEFAGLPPEPLAEALARLRARRRALTFVHDELTRLKNLDELPAAEQVAWLRDWFRVQRQVGALLAAGTAAPLLTPAMALLPSEEPLPELEQAADLASFERALRQLEFRIEVGVFEEMLRQYEAQPWLKAADADAIGRRRLRLFDDLTGQFDNVLLDARNERIDRLRWPDLPATEVCDVDVIAAPEEEALEAVGREAVTSRLDLMNRRAELVDAWRRIAVTANSLLGVLNVAYHMDSFSPLGEAKPLAFAGRRTRHQLIVSGELPLVRLNERNVYRASLIAFQRARRAVMEAEDRVLAQVRRELRQLRVLAENYRLQQNAVDAAYRQVESLIANLQAPPAQGEVGATRYASLTEQLLSALNSLANAQNTLVGTWVNYHTTRWQLYRDLERMPLDHRGVWIDELAPAEPEPPSGLFAPELPAPRPVVAPAVAP